MSASQMPATSALDAFTLGLAAAVLKPLVHDGLAPGQAACLMWDTIAQVDEDLARETPPERFGEYAAAALVLLTSPRMSD